MGGRGAGAEHSAGRSREPACAEVLMARRGGSEEARAPGEREILATRAEQAAGLGSWELDLDTGEVEWSENLYRLMGLEVGEVDASVDYFLANTHPDDREDLREAVERLRAGEDVEFV